MRDNKNMCWNLLMWSDEKNQHFLLYLTKPWNAFRAIRDWLCMDRANRKLISFFTERHNLLRIIYSIKVLAYTV